jgi:hypothetical protein
MVAIHLDANYIFVKPLRSRLKEEMIKAHKKVINRMRHAGLGIKKHILDNEASDTFKQYIRQQQIQSSWSHRAATDATRQSKQSKPSKCTSSQSWQVPLSLWCHLL